MSSPPRPSGRLRPRGITPRAITTPEPATTPPPTDTPDRTASPADPTGEPVADHGLDHTPITEVVLFTAEEAAAMLQVRPSWLRRRASARAVPCRFLGKHLRFARTDIEQIAEMSKQQPGGAGRVHPTR